MKNNFDTQIGKYTQLCLDNCQIDPSLNIKHKVFRGLRDLEGHGVLTGLTEISDVIARKEVDGKEIYCPGELYYRGYDVKKIVADFTSQNRFGFEEVTYLLLFGELPNKQQLIDFKKDLASLRPLPDNFVRDVIMKAPSRDMMNSLARSVLTLYSYDLEADDTSIPNLIRQCLQLIARFPSLAVYSYNAYNYHMKKSNSFFIHEPDPNLSTAENILHMLRIDGKYTALEAKVLDMALVLHAEHGGGNNSTFTTRVLSSSGTDTYSAIGSAICSLKGPKHGGANAQVIGMFDDLQANVADWTNENQVYDYLVKILRKEAYNKTGLIYGMGHAVYTLSDPRAVLLKEKARKLCIERDEMDIFNLYDTVERISPDVFHEVTGKNKTICANVDLYSGLIYRLLKIPEEMFTPMFAIARTAGWCAHRMEEVISGGRIIRPAYKNVVKHGVEYVDIAHRK